MSVGRQVSREASVYSPLICHRREVRLLRILSGPTDLHCELTTVSLDDAPSYDALSYHCGTAEADCGITLNQQKFNVRPNVYTYLQLMAREDVKGWIFIDTICINQPDIGERGSQVGLMGSIYNQAMQVVVWLSPHPVPCDLSEARFHYWVQRQWQIVIDRTQEELLSGTNGAANGSLSQWLSDTVPDWPCSGQSFDFLLPMLLTALVIKQPYWSRLWIVSECLLARKITIRYSKLRLSCEVLRECIARCNDTLQSTLANRLARSAARHFYHETEPDCNGVSALYKAMEILEERRLIGNKPLAQKVCALPIAIDRFSHHECSLAKDRVFALLSIAPSFLKPDYGMTINDLYIRALIESLMYIWSVENCRIHMANANALMHGKGDLNEVELVQGLVIQSMDLMGTLQRALGLDLFDVVTWLTTAQALSKFGLSIEYVGTIVQTLRKRALPAARSRWRVWFDVWKIQRQARLRSEHDDISRLVGADPFNARDLTLSVNESYTQLQRAKGSSSSNLIGGGVRITPRQMIARHTPDIREMIGLCKGRMRVRLIRETGTPYLYGWYLEDERDWHRESSILFQKA